MATSTVPAFKAALRTLLQARTGLANVQVTYGPPLPVPESEFIWLGDVQGAQDRAAMAGTTVEQYDATVLIRVLTSTAPDDFKTAGDRAFALMAEVENCVRADQTVSGTVNTAHVTNFVFEEDAAPEQTSALISVTVQVTAYI